VSPLDADIRAMMTEYAAHGMPGAQCLGSEIIKRRKLKVGECAAFADAFAAAKKEHNAAGLARAVTADALGVPS
jgi:hypothetical protein